MTPPLTPSLIRLVQSVALGLQVKQTELLFTLKKAAPLPCLRPDRPRRLNRPRRRRQGQWADSRYLLVPSAGWPNPGLRTCPDHRKTRRACGGRERSRPWSIRHALFEAAGRHCAYCGADVPLMRGHVVPRACGGSNRGEHFATAATPSGSSDARGEAALGLIPLATRSSSMPRRGAAPLPRWR
jgi:5-methylcytosine-specific restriction endonuclease McrA